ncbi:homoserine O-acetyltransferase [Kluyveromyces marxianus]|uniref:Homoserine O-acetyltransferase n=2 Tax=Kluyveromyces marxianus TaxID=4911 RepID=W0T2B8_KLUMD|nr:homoserine O-acetyltransferase [Kluyveromyces marxianus DMKU3-1042]QGN14116.1 homoserine O-acetyltransferase [Kluyveromyces marxianus]BAO37712.1 homoserine O-acetyltransferase [Kluyveromyces marxianus DMKU3-1042]BAP69280.1 homoserine O-acetyltransferase [Kluyveromyces marxianus]
MTTVHSALKELDQEELAKSNPFIKLVHGQTIVEVPELELECGITISNFPIAYKTWGYLNEAKDNVLVICHALTGSSDVADWWGPLLGTGLAFDPSKFFVICLNSMGSPYGSFSPLSIDASTGERYGPEFPLCTVRDDVRAHKIVLDSLGVSSIACVIGGSMGGMVALEWSAIYGSEYVKNLVALATSARHSAWCISWSEAQRQSIYSDPKYMDGYYSLDEPPTVGLSAARMSALLTYRSRNSFENKFSRSIPSLQQQQKSGRLDAQTQSQSQSQLTSKKLQDLNKEIHNDGNRSRYPLLSERKPSVSSISSSCSSRESCHSLSSSTSVSSLSKSKSPKQVKPAQTYFSAQSYLRYQGEKFVKRFDANCYISITRKLDTHDLARDRNEEDIANVLESFKQPALIIGISSDGLFTYSEQEFLAAHIPNARLEKINSPEGHDAFLLEFKLINKLIKDFLAKNCKELVESEGRLWQDNVEVVTNSVFGEAEEVTNW